MDRSDDSSDLAQCAKLDPKQGGFVRATSVAVDNRGLLICGPSGSGKSSLALGMIALGASLVSDDITFLEPGTNRAPMSPPHSGAGFIEARGLGLLRLPFVEKIPIWAVVALHAQEHSLERLPEPQKIEVFGRSIPLLNAAYASSLAAALFVCLRHNTLPTDQAP